ncbi:MAG: ComF family protein [Candidatus Woesebacteria bacterium]|nr:MAG: ComF family protein [Candidatus Woesebacteria bacterium]
MDLLDFIFPPKCLECGKIGKYICSECLAKIPKTSYKNRYSYSIWKYQGIVRRAIISLKYKFAYKLSDELAKNAFSELKKRQVFDGKDFVLVPVPLYSKRKNFRGFNQSEVVGKKLAELMKWEYEERLVIKLKNTLTQVGLRGDSRRKNLKNAFGINKEKLNRNKNYLIFDDVLTTGSTIDEIRLEFKKTGIFKVFSLTLAR